MGRREEGRAEKGRKVKQQGNNKGGKKGEWEVERDHQGDVDKSQGERGRKGRNGSRVERGNKQE